MALSGREHGSGLRRVPESDQEEPLDKVLARVALGDRQAFSALYDRVSPVVFGLARRVVRDSARAEEVAQEVFLQVWQSSVRFDSSRGNARTWILTLAHRRAVDAVRRDQSSRDREDRYDWSGGPGVDTVPEEVGTRLEHEQLRRCLSSLTELQREAVSLAYYEGHTYAKVSALLMTNPSTVKTRMRDGLNRLRDCLESGHPKGRPRIRPA